MLPGPHGKVIVACDAHNTELGRKGFVEARGRLVEVDSLLPCRSQDQSRVIRLGSKSLHSLRHLAGLSKKPSTDTSW